MGSVQRTEDGIMQICGAAACNARGTGYTSVNFSYAAGGAASMGNTCTFCSC